MEITPLGPSPSPLGSLQDCTTPDRALPLCRVVALSGHVCVCDTAACSPPPDYLRAFLYRCCSSHSSALLRGSGCV